MEAVALLGLVGAGFLVAKTAGRPQQVVRPAIENTMKVTTNEGFQTAQSAQPPSKVAKRGTPSELDTMYKTNQGSTLPSEPVPGNVRGNAFNYATKPAATGTNTMVGMNVFHNVAMNPAGIEKDPVYSSQSDDYIVSPLSGERINAKEYKHNNMQPFYGGRVKQNVNVDQNTSLLDSFTGAGSIDIRKKEIEPMFNTSKTPFGNPFGNESSADFVRSRMNESVARTGEKPFEPTRVGPAIGEKFGTTGKGGFQQFDVNEIMRKAMPSTDKLRTADNAKVTFNTPVVPGQRFITATSENPGEIRQYKPDTYFADESGERYIGAFSAESQRETARPIQIMPFTTRPETSTEVMGPAGSQDAKVSYVTGEYRSPHVQQHGATGIRNATLEGFYTDGSGEEADYGRSSIEIRPNERAATSTRVMGLNVVPADNQQVSVHYTDGPRPTNRAETVGNIRQTGTATGYASAAPAITVWDPNEVARTTVKEGTLDWAGLGLGIASPADGPTKLKVYDPDDIPRATQKSAISAKSEYFGNGDSARKDFTSHAAAYNMRLNPSKQQISKGRKPLAGNGGIATVNGSLNQTSKQIKSDIINDRELRQTQVTGLPPGPGDLGAVRYRTPLKLDVSLQRNQPSILSAVEKNPFAISLHKLALDD